MTRLRRLLLSGFALMFVGLVFAANRSASKFAGNAGRIQGETEIAVAPDEQQFNNPAVPVVVFRSVFGLSDPDTKAKREPLIKEVILENRSTKDISSVTVRWVITPLNSRTTPLARGEFNPHVLQSLHKTLRAGQRQTLKLSHPKLITLIEQVPNLEAMGNKFIFFIGVAEVVFADGSSWKEESTDVSNKSDVSK